MKMADFARTQLLKYGWTEGKGLGKHENGISEALRPKLKFDTTGIGHDASEYHWWEFVYNKASDNITVDTESHNVHLNIKDENAVDIKTSKSALNLGKIKKEQNLHYGSFIKTSTLENGEITTNPSYTANKYEAKEETSQLIVLNDEDLFKACGGRTAHKGARHGLELNGKLARIQRQEQELLEKMNNARSPDQWVQVEKKKKKKNRPTKMDTENEVNRSIQETTTHSTIIPNSVHLSPDDYSPTPWKKTRTKVKRRLDNLSHMLETTLALSTDALATRAEESSNTLEDTILSKKGRKNRKRKKKQCDTLKTENVTDTVDVGDNGSAEEIIESPKKRYKKEILDASVLNYKIEKRKRNKKAKKERKILENLSSSLMTLDLVENSETIDRECEKYNEVPRKKEKKSKN